MYSTVLFNTENKDEFQKKKKENTKTNYITVYLHPFDLYQKVTWNGQMLTIQNVNVMKERERARKVLASRVRNLRNHKKPYEKTYDMTLIFSTIIYSNLKSIYIFVKLINLLDPCWNRLGAIVSFDIQLLRSCNNIYFYTLISQKRMAKIKIEAKTKKLIEWTILLLCVYI